MSKFFTPFTTTGAVTDPKRANYNDPLKKENIYMFTNQQEKKKKCESLGNVLALFDKKRLDLKYVLQWSDTCKPWATCSKVDQR